LSLYEEVKLKTLPVKINTLFKPNKGSFCHHKLRKIRSFWTKIKKKKYRRDKKNTIEKP